MRRALVASFVVAGATAGFAGQRAPDLRPVEGLYSSPSPVDPVDSAVVSPVLASPVLLDPLELSPLELSPPVLELSPLEPSVALTAPVVPVLDASVGSPVAVALSVAPVIVASVLVGTTVVAALVSGAVLLVLDRRAPRRVTHAAPLLAPGVAGLQLVGHF